MARVDQELGFLDGKRCLDHVQPFSLCRCSQGEAELKGQHPRSVFPNRYLAHTLSPTFSRVVCMWGRHSIQHIPIAHTSYSHTLNHTRCPLENHLEERRNRCHQAVRCLPQPWYVSSRRFSLFFRTSGLVLQLIEIILNVYHHADHKQHQAKQNKIRQQANVCSCLCSWISYSRMDLLLSVLSRPVWSNFSLL